jgi:haloalkane dehalogenase
MGGLFDSGSHPESAYRLPVVTGVELKREGTIAYRETLPDREQEAVPVLLLHGFPESSYMWRHLMSAIAASGRRAIAPDLPGYGDSPPDPPGTWEHHVDAVERFRRGLGLDRVALVVHDWGGLIGLRWACEHPGAVTALVVSNTGFFPDGEWHEMAKTMRTKGEGEALVRGVSREGLGAMLGGIGRGFDQEAVDEYWKAFASEEGRQGMLELYRSGDFEKLEPYQDKLAGLGIPMLVLWGENDEYAPVTAAYRFGKEVPGAELVVVEGAGHFVFEDEPERCAREVTGFLGAAESG